MGIFWIFWSEQWDSNPQRPPWQGGTLANWAMLANRFNIYKSKKNQEKIEFFPFASRTFFYILFLCLVKNLFQSIGHSSRMNYKILLQEEYLLLLLFWCSFQPELQWLLKRFSLFLACIFLSLEDSFLVKLFVGFFHLFWWYLDWWSS